MLRQRARDNDCWVALVNAVGGQDELIFDGHSVVIAPGGEVVARAPSFEEALLVVDIDAPGNAENVLRLGEVREQDPVVPTLAEPLPELEQMRLALELGLRDYLDKNGFREIVLGLSGGIDSALTATLAVEALGPERVIAVSMPSRYSSAETQVGRAGARREPRHPLPRAADRGRRRGAWTQRSRSRSRAPSPGSRRRTSRRACAGSSSWRSRTSSAGSSSRPGTRASWRSATRRSTATWPAGSRSSRTCSRRTCSAWRAT